MGRLGRWTSVVAGGMRDGLRESASVSSLLSDPNAPPVKPVCALWRDSGYRYYMPRRQHPYPSDLSDARWKLLEPTLTAWRAERRGKSLDIGRPPEHDLRRIMDAILYVDRTGIPGATCRMTSPLGKPSTGASPPGRRTRSLTSSTASCGAWSARP